MTSPFAEHQIVNRVLTPELGSWLLKRPDPGANPDGYTNALGCRVTAADGLLTVTGDFYPVTFSHFGKGHPVACVRWMGSHDHVGSYVAEKARNGSGHDAVTEYSVDKAKADLHRISHDDVPMEALSAGLRCCPNEGGRDGVREIIGAVLDVDPDAGESVWGIGERPAKHLVFALQALNRLVALLDAEQASEAGP
jgi:hypothetical protein